MNAPIPATLIPGDGIGPEIVDATLDALQAPFETPSGGRFDKIDLVVVRENLEGLYIGHEHCVPIAGG